MVTTERALSIQAACQQQVNWPRSTMGPSLRAQQPKRGGPGNPATMSLTETTTTPQTHQK